MRGALSILLTAAVGLMLAGCGSNTSEKEKIYDIKGKVVSFDVEKKKVRLDHEDIPGLMNAMEMDFSVSDAKLLSGVKVGDAVKGRVTKG